MSAFNDCIDAIPNLSLEMKRAIKESPAPLDAINTLTATVKQQRREAAIQALRIAQQWERITSHPDYGTKPARAIIATMTKDITGRSGYTNVDMAKQRYEHKYHSMWAEGLNRFRSKMTFNAKKGFIEYDEEGLLKLTKAIMGEAVDDPEIAALAKQYHKMQDTMRGDFNELGGSIHKNERWNMPQKHDAATVNKYGEAQWLSDIEGWIDPRYMTDDFGKPLSPEDLKAGLAYAYESIITGGLNKAKDFTAPPRQSKKMARRGSDKRFLFFKDAESWTAYQNKYGRGDVFQTLVSNINDISSDMANMEIWGTNPRSAYDAIVQQVEKESGALNGSDKQLLNAVFKISSGTVDQGEITTLADFMQSFRNVITASRLGGAFLSSISDEGTSLITAKYNNLPYLKILKRKATLMSGSAESKELNLQAVKMGFGAESWIRMASSSNRYGDVYNVGKTGKMAEVVMRASLLEPFTDAGRKSFTMEYAALLADNFGKRFDELDKKQIRAFKSYGIDEADWDKFRASTPIDFKGAKYADMLQDGSEKFHQMIMSEVDYAVPTPDSRVSAITGKATPGGSASGQIMRTIMNLKTFPITMMSTHISRMVYQSTAGEQLSYAASLLAASTLFGAVAMQAKDVAKGREPRMPTEDNFKAFWGAAVAQGGGVGILGDFLFSDVNRFGHGIIATAPGPTGGIIEDALGLTLGYVQKKYQGEDTNWSLDFMRFVESNSPTIWQVQPIKSAMFDQIELMIDPQGAQKRWNRARKKQLKEMGTGNWWKPGDITPEFVQ